MSPMSLLLADRTNRARFNFQTALLKLLVVICCALIGVGTKPASATTLPVKISISPKAASVESAQTQQFTATVTNTDNMAVTWSATSGSISSAGLFKASTVKTDLIVSVTATSVADPTKSATALVTVTPLISVSISPTSATVNSLDTQAFKATVTNSSRNGVTWLATKGTITDQGMFTAPSVTTTTTASVTATSVADPTKLATVIVTVLPAVSVKVTPSSASVLSSGTEQLSATVSNTSDTGVTWSTTAGSVNSAGLFHAPSVTTNTTCVVTAKSQADRTKTATSTITVTPVSPLTISTTALPVALSGTSYNTTLAAAGGTAPYTWTISSQYGGFPTGFSLNSNGTISGNTAETGSFSLYLTVTDSSPQVQKTKETITLTVNLNVGGSSIPATAFNMHINRANTPWPSAPVAGQRFWDTGVTWALINTAQGVYDWTLMDQRLSTAQSNGADVLYDLAMTPVWAQCGPSTPSPCTQTPDCSYAGTNYGGGNGQCYWPADLNLDGTGADQYWKEWVTAVATHSVNSGVGHIKYYEIWNEPNETSYWRGTTAQLVRMAQDAACIIKGTSPGCSGPGIDPTALIITPAPTLGGDAINTWMQGYFAAGGDQVSDIIGFHGYNKTDPEKIPIMASTLRDGALTTYGQLNKPLFDTEFSWGEGVVLSDPDEQAGFVARSWLLHWSSGVSRVYWYGWDLSGVMWTTTSTTGCTTPDEGGFLCEIGTAYIQVQSWMVGTKLSQACVANGTVWTCNLTKAGGYQALAVWDTAQSCNNGVCTTSTYTFPPVKPNYIHYLDLSGNSTTIKGTTVPIGYKPILLENQ
jgi:hypothetical protein